MHFIAYQNHPLRTVNARAAARDAIGALVKELTFGKDAEIRPFTVTPRKAYHEIAVDPESRAVRVSDPYLTTEQLFEVVPVEIVAKAVCRSEKECQSWGRRVPQAFELYLRDLMDWWPRIREAHRLRNEFNATNESVSKACKSPNKLLLSQCNYFNLPLKDRRNVV